MKNKFLADAAALLASTNNIDPNTASTEMISRLWTELHSHYTNSKRHYHNLQHLASLFGFFDEYRSKLQQPTVVTWAIWYHDIIYNARRRDNELQSAQLAKTRLQELTMPTDKINEVVKFIEATAQHMSVNASGDLAYFLDFDLAILGSEPEAYRLYSQAIRKEYRHVPGFLYRRGRRKVLHYFLDTSHLFRTDALRARFEEQARQNIQWELTELS